MSCSRRPMIDGCRRQPAQPVKASLVAHPARRLRQGADGRRPRLLARKRSMKMQIGMIGLGRIGASMAKRLLRGGHDCVLHDRAPESVAQQVALGATGATLLTQFVNALKAPRAVWLMVPAAAVDALLDQLKPLLQAGDTVIDRGNSHHHDDLRRAATLAQARIAHVDVGTSGGVAGLERGYCLMIGAPSRWCNGSNPCSPRWPQARARPHQPQAGAPVSAPPYTAGCTAGCTAGRIVRAIS